MTIDTLSAKIQLRRGTETEWTTANPILSAGEIGVENDTGLFKLGDGATSWADLEYFIHQGDIVDLINAAGGGGGISLAVWNSTTAYSVGDMVIVNDVGLGSDKAIYIATQANTNLYPMDNVPTWIYVGGPAQASGISGQIQVSDGSGFATGDSEFTYNPSYHQFKIGSASVPVSIDHRGSFSAVGTAEWWASDGSGGYGTQLWRFDEAGSFSLGRVPDVGPDGNTASLRKTNGGNLRVVIDTTNGPAGLEINEDGRIGIVRNDGSVDYPSSADDFLEFNGTELSWGSLTAIKNFTEDLSGLVDTTTARSNLGLGALSTKSTVDPSDIVGALSPSQLGSGLHNSGTFLRGDGTWSAVDTSLDEGQIVLLSQVFGG
jgi:hypothetical protein